MQGKFSLAYFVCALGLTMLMVGVGAQAKIAFVSDRAGAQQGDLCDRRRWRVIRENSQIVRRRNSVSLMVP